MPSPGSATVLTVAVDASWAGLTGIGRFAAEVLDRVPSGVEIRKVREHQKNVHVLAPLQLKNCFLSSGAQVLWSPGFIPAALPAGSPQAVTVHDLLHVHHYGPAHRLYYETVMRTLLSRVPLIFTVSEFSRGELIEWANIPPDRVVAVHHGLSATYRADGDELSLGAPYVLYVGNRRHYKNLGALLRAYQRSGIWQEGILLALSGDPEPRLERLAATLGVRSSLRWLGTIAESRLPAVYRGARAVAFVSLYEGFGFPIIEAMGCCVPVLTSDAASMPEVAGGAALLVDPLDCDAIADGLRRVCLEETLRDTLVSEGAKRAACFSWDSCAETYWRLLAELQ